MQKFLIIRRFLEQYWDLGVVAFSVLIVVFSLAANLAKPLNILNEPWAIPILFIVGYIGFISIALYISERRRHSRRLRVKVRAVLIGAILVGLFLVYRQITLITNPPGRILVVIAVDADRGTPESRELMNKIWQELNTEVNLQHIERVKVIQRKIAVADTKAAEKTMAQRECHVLIWMSHKGAEDSLNISIAADRLPEMLTNIFNTEEKQKASISATEDLHIVLDIGEDPNKVMRQVILSTIGLIYYNDREYSKALTHFREALDRTSEEETHPFGRKALYRFLALTSCQIGDCVSALKYSEELVSLAPDDCKALIWLADAHINLGELDDAITVCQRVLNLDPANVEAYLHLATAYVDQGDLEKAAEYLKKVMEIEPENSSAHNNMGFIYAEKGDYEEASAEIEKALEINPNNALYHANLGSLYEEQNDILNAIRKYQMAVKMEPQSAYYHYLLGGAWLKLGTQMGVAKAHYEFRKANLLAPYMEFHTSTTLAHASMAWGDKQQAIEQFSRAIRVASSLLGPRELSTAYNIRGDAYRKLKDYKRAIADHDKAIELNPNNEHAYYFRGYVYLDLKEYEKAIVDFNKAIEIASNSERTYCGRGFYYYELKEYEKAIADFDEGIRLNPRYSYSYYMLAVIYKERGEREKAIENLKKVLEIGRDQSLVKKAEKLLEELGEKDDSTSHSHSPLLVGLLPIAGRH
jgi:tetratricopeptide (TPR) repeat protein